MKHPEEKRSLLAAAPKPLSWSARMRNFIFPSRGPIGIQGELGRMGALVDGTVPPNPRGQEKPMLLPKAPPPRWVCRFKAEVEMHGCRNSQLIIAYDGARYTDAKTRDQLQADYGADFDKWCATLRREMKTRKWHDSDHALIRTANIAYILFSITQWVDDKDPSPKPKQGEPK